MGPQSQVLVSREILMTLTVVVSYPTTHGQIDMF